MKSQELPLRRATQLMQQRQCSWMRPTPAFEQNPNAAERPTGNQRCLPRSTSARSGAPQEKQPRPRALQNTGPGSSADCVGADDELKTHICPVCCEVMCSPRRTPTVLFPCGHTFCSACISQMERMKKRKCPYCRTLIQGETVNVPLQQLVSRMQKPQSRSTASSISSPQVDPETSTTSISVQNGDDMGQKYLDEFRNSSMRCRALHLQLKDVSQQETQFKLEQQKSKETLDFLSREEQDLCEKVQLLEKKIEVVRKRKDEVSQRFHQCLEEVTNVEEKKKQLLASLEPLERQKDKARMLLKNFRPFAEFSDEDD